MFIRVFWSCAARQAGRAGGQIFFFFVSCAERQNLGMLSVGGLFMRERWRLGGEGACHRLSDLTDRPCVDYLKSRYSAALCMYMYRGTAFDGHGVPPPPLPPAMDGVFFFHDGKVHRVVRNPKRGFHQPKYFGAPPSDPCVSGNLCSNYHDTAAVPPVV